jgi:hypothetical protein
MSGTWLAGNERRRGLSLTIWETGEQAQEFADHFGPGAGAAPNVLTARLPSFLWMRVLLSPWIRSYRHRFAG